MYIEAALFINTLLDLNLFTCYIDPIVVFSAQNF